MFVSFVVLASTIGTLIAVIFAAIFPWLESVLHAPVMDRVPLLAVVLTALLMPMRAVSNVTTTLFSVTGKGISIAIQLASQAVVGFACALLGLFVLKLHVSALVFSAFCGQIAALTSGLYMSRGAVLTARPSRVWLWQAVRTVPTTGTLGLAEGARGALDNVFLASADGLTSAAYFAHARLYNGLLMALTNSVGHNIWSTSLSEARDPLARFAATTRAWAPLQLALVLCAFAFVFVGREIVDVISHGKLTSAAAYIPALIVVLLIQNSGKSATAIVYANNRALAAARFRIAVILIGSVTIWPAIRWFGISGLIAVMLVEALAYRLWLRVLAARTARLPFEDGIIVAGAFAIAASAAFVDIVEPSLPIRVTFLFASIGICLGLGRSTVSDIVATSFDLLGSRPRPATPEVH